MKFNRASIGEKKGFTLLELLVSMGILAIILAIASAAMGSYSRILGSITVERANMHEARLAMEKITDVINEERRASPNLILRLDNPSIITGGIKGSDDTKDLVIGTPSYGPEAKIYLNNRRELRDQNGELIARYIESIGFERVYGEQLSIVPLDDEPILVPPGAQFIKVTIKTDKNQDNINSCSIDTLFYCQ